MGSHIVLGVDIGGSHITAMLIDLHTGQPVEGEVRENVNAKGSADAIISLWADVINRAFSTRDIKNKQIGIAMPGPFNYNTGIAWMKDQDKYDSLYGLNVKELLAEKLNIPLDNIRFLNDAESFLKGEVFNGAAQGSVKTIGLTFGTGLGSARYSNGNIEDADLWNTSFLESIAENYLSTRWFVARYLQLSGNTVKGVKELAVLAEKDTIALEVFKQFGNNLGLFLKDIIKAEKPEIVVLGGNIANAFHLFYDEVNIQLIGLNSGTVIKRSNLGERASLIGAASSWSKVPETVAETVRA